MTTGALIFAFNNERIDYVNMAAWNARRIKKYLGIPVALITDHHTHAKANEFDLVITAQAQPGGTRYFDDYDQTVTWNNASRTDAYVLTPWDQTLVLDADYVVDSTNLLVVLESQKDFLCFRESYDMAAPIDQPPLLDTFGRYSFPMWWATVMMFRRSPMAEYIFDSMRMVKQNWQHYRDLYSIDKSTYRNDYALSIALGIVSGHTLKVDAIPWPMPNVLPGHRLERDGADWIIYFNNQQQQPRKMLFRGMDFHAMGKQHLEKIIASES